METIEILKTLCDERGISGFENEMHDIICSLLPWCSITQKSSGTVIASFGDDEAKKRIMLDAHLDRIGMIVTYINEDGFIKCENVGGLDLRALPSSAVTVNGRKPILGVICTRPPHLSDSDETDKNNIWVDTGLPADRVRELVQQGDSVVIKSRFAELLGDKVSCAALDNRAGCAALIKCAELLRGKALPCRVYLVFSSQEETNESGAATAAFSIEPSEAIVVDVGFAEQSGVPQGKSGKLGNGVIISIAPTLSRKMTDTLITLAGEMNIGTSFEVDGGRTGTNADGISVANGGIPCAVVSIPVKNMHTQTETVSIGDINACAALLAKYIQEEENDND